MIDPKLCSLPLNMLLLQAQYFQRQASTPISFASSVLYCLFRNSNLRFTQELKKSRNFESKTDHPDLLEVLFDHEKEIEKNRQVQKLANNFKTKFKNQYVSVENLIFAILEVYPEFKSQLSLLGYSIDETEIRLRQREILI